MLYLDASAWIKRYIDEDGSEQVNEAMARARRWLTCRVGYVETARVVGRLGGAAAVKRLQADWPSLGVVELDLAVAEEAAEVAIATGLRSLDAIHLAAALSLPADEVTFATWDARLHEAARERGLALLPESLSAVRTETPARLPA